jgi:hypothetical protein
MNDPAPPPTIPILRQRCDSSIFLHSLQIVPELVRLSANIALSDGCEIDQISFFEYLDRHRFAKKKSLHFIAVHASQLTQLRFGRDK